MLATETPPWAESVLPTGSSLDLGVLFEPGAITDPSDVALFYVEDTDFSGSALGKYRGVVPEPSMVFMLVSGVLGLAGLGSMRRR